jgi:hypothetical protein
MMGGVRYDDTARHHLTKARPEARDLGAVCPRRRPVPLDAAAHFARRALVIRGLMAGSLDAAEAVVLTRPAVELLALLVPIDGLTERYLAGRHPEGLQVRAGDFEFHRRELLAVVAAMLDRWLGDDPELWLEAVARAGAWRGSFPELIAAVAGADGAARLDWSEPESGRTELDKASKASKVGEPAQPAERGGRAPRWPRGVDASAVLLAMAPPGLVELFLEDCRQNPASRGILVRMLDRGPLIPALVEAATAGTVAMPAMAEASKRNPAFAVAELREQVWRDHGNVKALQAIYRNPSADLAIRIGCVWRAEAVGGFSERFMARLLSAESHPPLVEPLLASSDPELVHRLLKRLSRHPLSTPALRWAAYATLARAAGPEPVWALEQERAGRLEKMAEPVRASMATGAVAPILAEAEARPLVFGEVGTARELGAPDLEPWPYTALIREHVEKSRRRQRAVDLLRVRVEEGAASP